MRALPLVGVSFRGEGGHRRLQTPWPRIAARRYLLRPSPGPTIAGNAAGSHSEQEIPARSPFSCSRRPPLDGAQGADVGNRRSLAPLRLLPLLPPALPPDTSGSSREPGCLHRTCRAAQFVNGAATCRAEAGSLSALWNA